jgi:stage III sporulation protein AH
MMVINLSVIKKNRGWIIMFIIMGIVAVSIRTYTDYYAKRDYNRARSVTKPVAVTMQEQATTVPVAVLDFFVEYRVERDRLRSERMDLLREVAKNSKDEDGPRLKAQDTIIKITVDKQKELEVENMIKAKGFADAIVFLGENSINVIVKANTLAKEEVIQIADLIVRGTGIGPEHITISAKQ